MPARVLCSPDPDALEQALLWPAVFQISDTPRAEAVERKGCGSDFMPHVTPGLGVPAGSPNAAAPAILCTEVPKIAAETTLFQASPFLLEHFSVSPPHHSALTSYTSGYFLPGPLAWRNLPQFRGASPGCERQPGFGAGHSAGGRAVGSSLPSAVPRQACDMWGGQPGSCEGLSAAVGASGGKLAV